MFLPSDAKLFCRIMVVAVVGLCSGRAPNPTETQKELKWPNSDSKVTPADRPQSDPSGPHFWVAFESLGVALGRDPGSHFWVTFGSLQCLLFVSVDFRGFANLKGGFQKGGFGGCSPVPKTGTRVHSDVPRYQKTERRYIRMFPGTKNRNEGTPCPSFPWFFCFYQGKPLNLPRNFPLRRTP